MTRFEEYCQRQRATHGERFSPPRIPALIDAYNKGRSYRIKVRTTYASGEKRERWGFVGVTTGWSPAFILMRSTRAFGSSDLLSDRDEIIDFHYRSDK